MSDEKNEKHDNPNSIKLTIHPVIFNNTNATKFEKMIVNSPNSLFIYNENFGAYTTGSKGAGDGNATIRPFRQDVNIKNETFFSLGIPTGFLDDKQKKGNENMLDNRMLHFDYTYYTTLDTTLTLFSSNNPVLNTNELFMYSLTNIYKYIKNNKNITHLYYSADENDNLGFGIFGIPTNKKTGKSINQWTTVNKNTINNAFRALLSEISMIRDISVASPATIPVPVPTVSPVPVPTVSPVISDSSVASDVPHFRHPVNLKSVFINNLNRAKQFTIKKENDVIIATRTNTRKLKSYKMKIRRMSDVYKTEKVQ
jgi:hypothetical protein